MAEWQGFLRGFFPPDWQLVSAAISAYCAVVRASRNLRIQSLENARSLTCVVKRAESQPKETDGLIYVRTDTNFQNWICFCDLSPIIFCTFNKKK
jgi:hypothetical protein